MEKSKVTLRLLAALVLLAGAPLLAACDEEKEVSAEKLGKQLDETLEKAGEVLQEAAKETGEALEEAGEAVKEGIKEANETVKDDTE